MKDKDETKEQVSELVEILQYNVESENFYQNAFENVGIATAIFKKDNIILTINGEFEKLTGYTREEVEGKKKWMEFVNRKSDLDRMREHHRLRLIYPLSASKTCELQLVSRSGQVKDTVAAVSLIPGTKQALMTLLDITERKRMKATLRELEKRFADTINFLPDATFAVDLSGKVTVWNRAIEEMTGVKAENMLGEGNYEYAMVFYGVQRPLLIDLVFGFVEGIEKKYVFVKREGNALLAEAIVPVRGMPRILWGKAGPLYDGNGDIVGAIESVRDITALKRVEKTLQQIEAYIRDHSEAKFSHRICPECANRLYPELYEEK
jgi:PAS domain S-box-containing protein